MLDTSDVDALDPLAIMDAECARLERFFSGLDGAGWEQPTRCEGWRCREMVAHLAGNEEYNIASVEGRIKQLFREAAAAGVKHLDHFNDWMIRKRASMTTEEVLREWRDTNARFRAEMRSRGPEGTLDTSVGEYPVRLQGFHLASEYATHADDMAAPVEPGEEPGRTSWRARFTRFALKEENKPVDVEPLDGRVRVRAGGEEAELSERDFVEAGVGRLPPDHPLTAALRRAVRIIP